VADRCREQGTIDRAKPWPRDLAAQDLELVAQDEQLDVLDVQTAATADERAQQRPEREIQERDCHGRRSSQAARAPRDTSIGTLHAAVRPAQASDLSGLVLTASLIGQVLGIAAFVGLYLDAAPHRAAHALALTTGAIAAALIVTTVCAYQALTHRPTEHCGVAHADAAG
jgi:hypothetical protein